MVTTNPLSTKNKVVDEPLIATAASRTVGYSAISYEIGSDVGGTGLGYGAYMVDDPASFVVLHDPGVKDLEYFRRTALDQQSSAEADRKITLPTVEMQLWGVPVIAEGQTTPVFLYADDADPMSGKIPINLLKMGSSIKRQVAHKPDPAADQELVDVRGFAPFICNQPASLTYKITYLDTAITEEPAGDPNGVDETIVSKVVLKVTKQGQPVSGTEVTWNKSGGDQEFASKARLSTNRTDLDPGATSTTRAAVTDANGEAVAWLRWNPQSMNLAVTKPNVWAALKHPVSGDRKNVVHYLSGEAELSPPEVTCTQTITPSWETLVDDLINLELPPTEPIVTTFKVGDITELAHPVGNATLDCTVTQKNPLMKSMTIDLILKLTDEVDIEDIGGGIRNEDGSVTWRGVVVPANSAENRSVQGITWISDQVTIIDLPDEDE